MQLPAEALVELLHFIDYLKYRDKVAQPSGHIGKIFPLMTCEPYDNR